jgi:hypothetical protein
MTPPRKRPECRTCNTPMAGHKRPHGWPVCPSGTSPIRKLDEKDVEEVIPQIGQIYHWKNANWHENFLEHFTPPPAVRQQRSGTPNTWVSTEPADDIPPSRRSTESQETLNPRALVSQRHAEEIESYSSSRASSSATPSTTSSRIRRSFTNILNNSLPIVSIFSSPRDDVQTITQAARLNGLHTGVMRRPRNEVKEVKDEHCKARIGRRYSWWVLMGRDYNAVEELMGMHERDIMAKSDDQPQATPAATTMAQPPAIKIEGASMFQMVFCCVVGTLAGIVICFFILSIL